MDSPKSPAGSVKRHGRNISYARPRRSTVGPLEAADDPLSNPSPRSPSAASPSDVPSSRPSAELQSQVSEDDLTENAKPSIDLGFLKDTSNYHSLGTEDVPQVFLNSQNQPPLDTPLSDLLKHGYFRRGAERALIDLSQCPSDDAKRILQLLYTRLACLVLTSRADLASVEAASLTDYLARNPPGASDLVPIIPWELRLLLVRLQSIAATDGGRRSVMSLYAMAAEVRMQIKEAQDAGSEANLNLWSDRLRDLGSRVADTLVEMGELETATRHLDSLVDADGDELAYRKALLRLRVGDAGGAQRSADKIRDVARREALTTVLDVANGNLPQAIDKWQARFEEDPEDALSGSSLAVGLLYTGKLSQARQILEELAKEQPTFAGSLFNLSTVYELCTEHALDRKAQLAANTANKAPSPASGGWERANFEFKL